MVAEDLMIGDWVCVRSNDKEDTHNFKIKSIISEGVYGPSFVGFDEDLEPIPLTGEILKKNGFFYDDKNYILSYKEGAHDVALYISQMYMAPGFVTGTPDLNSKKPYSLNVFGTLHYVHDLQHLFKFLKIKKEIVL